PPPRRPGALPRRGAPHAASRRAGGGRRAVHLAALDRRLPPLPPRAHRPEHRSFPARSPTRRRRAGGEPGPADADLLPPRRRPGAPLARAADRRAAPLVVPALSAVGRVLAPPARAARPLPPAAGARGAAH